MTQTDPSGISFLQSRSPNVIDRIVWEIAR